MQVIQPREQKEQKSQAAFQEKMVSLFEQSLTEEQRFLQGVLSGEIKTYSNEEVMADLRKVLGRWN